MNVRTLPLVFATLTVAAVSACSADADRLAEDRGPSSPGAAPGQSPPAATPGTSGTVPGTQGAPAYEYFKSSVYAEVSACGSCHSSGSNGAPVFFGSDVTATYAALNGNGLILSASPLVTKGPHVAGAAPALAPTAEAVVRKWLAMEASERAGKAAPETIYAALAKCMNPDLFAKIDLCTAKTQPRPGESGDYCTGCKYETCSNCHASGGQTTGFWCSTKTENNRLVTNVDDTLEASKELPFIRRYFGFSGVSPAASNGILNKSKTTQTATNLVAHPWFTLDAARQKALTAFVDDALTRYAAGKCAP